MTESSKRVSKKNSMIWETIRQEEDMQKALDMVCAAAEEAIDESLSDRDSIRLELAKVNKTLCGNGDPSHSIIARLEDIEKYMATVGKVLTALLLTVLGEIVLKLLGLF